MPLVARSAARIWGLARGHGSLPRRGGSSPALGEVGDSPKPAEEHEAQNGAIHVLDRDTSAQELVGELILYPV